MLPRQSSMSTRSMLTKRRKDLDSDEEMKDEEFVYNDFSELYDNAQKRNQKKLSKLIQIKQGGKVLFKSDINKESNKPNKAKKNAKI